MRTQVRKCPPLSKLFSSAHLLKIWTAVPIDALLTAIEAHSKHMLGSFSSELTMASKQQAWKIVTTKIRICLYACMGIFCHFIVSLRHSRNMFLYFAS